MKQFLAALLILLLTSQSIVAQHDHIHGKVVNDNDRLPLAGITVTLLPTNKTAITDENGNFIFNETLAQITAIKFSGFGYEYQIIKAADFSLGAVISLKPKAATTLNEVIVNSGASVKQQNQISKLDIKMRGITNSQEVLRIVPGLFIGQHQGGGKAEQIFIRGFDCDHGTDISLNVDGMPINMVSHAHGQGYADAHFIIPETIESVDFKKGTYNAEKGNFDTAGYVDFKTANAVDKNTIKLEGGMFNTMRVVGVLNLLNEKQKANQQSWYMATEYNYSDGYFDNPQHFNRFNFFSKYHGKVSKSSFLDISASTLQSKWNASGQIPDRAVAEGLIGFYGALDPTEGGVTSRSNLNAQLFTTFKNHDLVKNQIYYTNYNFDLHTNFTFYLEDPVNGDQIRQKEKRNLFGYNGSYSHIGYSGETKFTTDAGINIRYDKTNNSELSHTVDRYTVINPIKLGDVSELNAGVYLSETIKFNERWNINAGLRFDQFYNQYNNKLATDPTLNDIGLYKANANIVSPKLSVYYHANAKTQFYIASGRGFHSNDTRAVVVSNGKEILPPAYGVDLGTIYKPTSNLLLHLAAWYMGLKQEFVYSGDGGIVEITGATKRIGLDGSVRCQPLQSLYIDIDINYAHGRYTDEHKGQDYIPLAPIWSSTGGIMYKNKNGFNGGIRYRYLSDRPAIEDNSLTAKGYFVTDAVLNYTKPRYEIGLRINNIFNTRWKETQFATETRLQNETTPVTEICFTPGTKFMALLGVSYFFN
ncbi:MAG TPA: TonB-dependent receptor [Flavobacterium sp.]|uniref:TonB-dependent receptor n=1 Tax=Flavobacterium sp. TaxID=239 RepID=UPI002BAD33C8|nr:TonB-dependent receptor [Flavobacterium sp.]HNP32316.1 TonB-dependent receptor [Flavobacterium sp.]